MSNKEQLNQVEEPLSYRRNCIVHFKRNATQGLFLLTQPCEELMREKELVLAQIDGYAIIPIEDYDALNISEQLRRRLQEQIGSG